MGSSDFLVRFSLRAGSEILSVYFIDDPSPLWFWSRVVGPASCFYTRAAHWAGLVLVLLSAGPRFVLLGAVLTREPMPHVYFSLVFT